MSAAVVMAALALAGAREQLAPSAVEGSSGPPESGSDLLFAESEQELQGILDAISEYDRQASEYKKEVQLLIERRYDERRAAVNEAFEKAIRDLEVLERQEREDAIGKFERFIQRYPDTPRYTPDAMFRLAELYFEKSQDEYTLAQRAFEAKIRRGGDAGPEPQYNYQPSIALYQTMITRFPDYRLVDGVHYLLGWSLEKQGEPDRAREIYLTLIDRYPKSRFVPEAWVRIGEYYFDAVNVEGALDKAAEAYTRLSAFPDHPLYDKAIYKLGWTYYRLAGPERLEDYQRSVDTFFALLDYYATKGEAAGDLRAEALQYSAVCFADEKWGSLQKALDQFARVGSKPYEAEVFRKLADIYFDNTKHADAVAAYRIFLARAPNHPDAPKVQQKIIAAYERDRNFDESAIEQQKLVDNYSDGTTWWEANRSDPDVVNAARDLAERSLQLSANFHQRQALEFKRGGKFDLAMREFTAAARAFTDYLTRFPHGKENYTMTFFQGEALLNSLEFVRAAEAYGKVRDSQLDVKHLAEAAYGAVFALQREIDRRIRSGELFERKALKSTERPEGAAAVPEELPELYQKFTEAADALVKKLPQDERAPSLYYKVGEIFYAHNQFDKARERFLSFIERWPQHELAASSAYLVIESYLIGKDWPLVEEWAQKLGQAQAAKKNKTLAADLQKFKLAARFKQAQKFFDDKEWDKSAKLFLAVVDEEPAHEFADKAVYNAAICNENMRRFDSALKLYERLTEKYPKSTLADTALFRVAYNAENSFDFDKAIERYLYLVERYPQSEKRSDALANAANALERTQRYPEAARAFLRYNQLFPEKPDAPTFAYQAGVVYEKMKDQSAAVAAYEAWLKKFGRDPKNNERAVEAYLKIAEAQRKLGANKNALKSYAAAVAEFDKRGLKPESAPLAAAAAAKARFTLVEGQFQDYDAIQITAKVKGRRFDKALREALVKKAESRAKVIDAYKEVLRYKSVEWMLAALFRIGFVDEKFSVAMFEAPVPPEFRRDEELIATYKDLLAQQAMPIEERAVSAYAFAAERAVEFRVVNEWTKRTLESLNRLRPRDWPLFKEGKGSLATEVLSPAPLAAVPAPQAPPAPAPAPVPVPEAPP